MCNDLLSAFTLLFSDFGGYNSLCLISQCGKGTELQIERRPEVRFTVCPFDTLNSTVQVHDTYIYLVNTLVHSGN